MLHIVTNSIHNEHPYINRSGCRVTNTPTNISHREDILLRMSNYDYDTSIKDMSNCYVDLGKLKSGLDTKLRAFFLENKQLKNISLNPDSSRTEHT